MNETKFIWKNGELIAWAEATTHVLTHALHYGSAVFEGIRCYQTDQGPSIFRLDRHVDRLFYSGSALAMDIPFAKEEIANVCKQIVRENGLEACYIRPLAYYGYGKMGLNPIGAPVDLIIACWPWGAYLGDDTVKIKVSDYIRIHPKTSVTDAKISGHYVNSIMASLEVHGDDRYHESLLLDYQGNVAEGPGENLFLVKDGALHTPKPGTILPGIKRDTVMTLAKEQGIEVVERVIAPDELHTADEAFFTGTAAEVIGITHIDDKPIGSGKMGPVTSKLRGLFLDSVHGRLREHKEWLFYI